MKESTSKRLREIMDDRGLKQVDIVRLAEPFCKEYKVRLGKNDVSQYVSGKVVPGQDKLKILSLALQVNEAWLMGYSVNKTGSTPLYSNISPMPETEKLPLLGTIACGTPILAVENIEEYIEIPRYINADFVLQCKGDSMINARIFDGDLVCIRKQPCVENGEIAAVIIDEEATLKRVRLFNDHISLEPENPMYKPLVFWGDEMNSVHIIGLATHFISPVR